MNFFDILFGGGKLRSGQTIAFCFGIRWGKNHQFYLDFFTDIMKNYFDSKNWRMENFLLSGERGIFLIYFLTVRERAVHWPYLPPHSSSSSDGGKVESQLRSAL